MHEARIQLDENVEHQHQKLAFLLRSPPRTQGGHMEVYRRIGGDEELVSCAHDDDWVWVHVAGLCVFVLSDYMDWLEECIIAFQVDNNSSYLYLIPLKIHYNILPPDTAKTSPKSSTQLKIELILLHNNVDNSISFLLLHHCTGDVLCRIG